MAKGKKGNSKKGLNQSKNDTSMVVYRGPIQSRSPLPDTYRIALKNTFNAVSNGAGILEQYINTSNATGCPDWASLGPQWREYRVLGLRFEYASAYDKGGAVRVGYPAVVASYHGPPPAWQGAVSGSSFQNTFEMEGSKIVHPCTNFAVEWRMSDIEEAQFFSTSTSYNSGGIYFVSGGTLSTSQTYGCLFATVLVEFKGRV